MSEKIKILVVEDERAWIAAFSELLKRKGVFQPVVKSNVRAVLNLLEEGFVPEVALIDLLVSDGGVREIDNRSFGLNRGLDLCKKIEEASGGRCRTSIR